MSGNQRDVIKQAKRVYLIGNGGSAANAVHIANDLISCGIRAQALTADVATLTAIANDFGYEYVFSRQLEVFGEPGDLLVALSGSGRSPNILNALVSARAKKMTTWAIFGAYNQLQPDVADIVTLAGDNMQEAEDHQIVWGHEVMRNLRKYGPVATLADGRRVYARTLADGRTGYASDAQVTTSTAHDC